MPLSCVFNQTVRDESGWFIQISIELDFISGYSHLLLDFAFIPYTLKLYSLLHYNPIFILKKMHISKLKLSQFICDITFICFIYSKVFNLFYNFYDMKYICYIMPLHQLFPCQN